jgi:GTP-binding protein Era
MMQAVKGSLEDADVALLLVDVRDKWEECDAIFSSLRLKVPALVVLNKTDTVLRKKVMPAWRILRKSLMRKKWSAFLL